MGDEVKMSEYDAIGDGDGTGGEDDRVLDWEIGLPTGEDLPSLSQSLIPPDLALAFGISPELARTLDDVNRVARSTVSSLGHGSHTSSSTATEEEEPRAGSSCVGSDLKKQKKSYRGDVGTAVPTAAEEEMDSLAEDSAARMMKRPRLVWTPQLHKRFVEVVTHLGIDKAVPKTIMQLMNVEGLTRENVASHLQKYRLYLKRMQGGLTIEGPSSSEKLFSSTPIPPQSFHRESVQANGGGGGHMGIPVPPVPYAAPPGMMPMPVFGQIGMQEYHHHYHHHNHGHDHYFQNHLHHGGGFESNPYIMQQRDWPGNKFASVAPYPPVGGGGNNEK